MYPRWAGGAPLASVNIAAKTVPTLCRITISFAEVLPRWSSYDRITYKVSATDAGRHWPKRAHLTILVNWLTISHPLRRGRHVQSYAQHYHPGLDCQASVDRLERCQSVASVAG